MAMTADPAAGGEETVPNQPEEADNVEFATASTVDAVISELVQTRACIAKYVQSQKGLYEEHLRQQNQLLQSLDKIHVTKRPCARHGFSTGSLSAGTANDNNSNQTECPSAKLRLQASSRLSHLTPNAWEENRPMGFGFGAGGRRQKTEQWEAAVGVSRQSAAKPEKTGMEGVFAGMQACEQVLRLWKHCSGLHTVQDWVTNYHLHPGGWAALLMIHGIPEVTSRLRTKVEHYAIYSALFLSMSIPLLGDKPEFLDPTCPELGQTNPWTWWICQLRLRVYFYGLEVGVAAHMLSILLAMAFLNALNEAARDADVFRMFSRGRGFHATVVCQRAFLVGCIADLISVATSVSYHLGWEALLVSTLLTSGTVVLLRRSARLLFRHVSIMQYWREEKGGKPDPSDPYDLDIPVAVFQERAQANERIFLHPPWENSPDPQADSRPLLQTGPSELTEAEEKEDDRPSPVPTQAQPPLQEAGGPSSLFDLSRQPHSPRHVPSHDTLLGMFLGRMDDGTYSL